LLILKKKYFMKRIFIILSFCLLFNPFTYSQNSFISDSLDNYVNYALKLWNIPGAAVVVVKDGKVVVAKGYGVKDMNSSDRVDENTLFMIASNTKAFTGTSLAILENDNRLNLDDKVIKWMPDFRLYDSVITQYVTIRDLLSHRLGLQTFQGDFTNWSSNLSRKEIIYNFRNHKPVFDFRSRYGYCNAGFLTAGEIIPIVTGISWEEFVMSNLIKPLDMKRTFLSCKIMSSDKNVTKGHTIDFEGLKIIPYDEVDNLGPAASICTNAKDIANWLLMETDSGRFNGNQVIPYKVIAKTIIPNIVLGLNQNYLYKGIKHIRAYGLGWQVEDYSGNLMVSHTGGVNGYVTSTCFLPEIKLGIAVFTNTDANYLYEALKYQIIEAYLNMSYRNFSNIFHGFYEQGNEESNKFYESEMKIVKQGNKTSFDLNEYTGKYYNSAYGEIDIKKEDNKLVINFSRHPFLKGYLNALGGNSFFCIYSHPGWGVKVIDFEPDNGKVKSVKIKVNDNIDFMEYDFEKMK
jgi:CubicO group peptidase (beta-lactamase class C family)